MEPPTVDLRAEPSARVQTAAFYAVRDLGPGEAVTLVTASDPALLLASLNLQLRDELAWAVAADGGGWRTTVRRRADTPPAGVIDVLLRDHHRLDALLATALRRLNADDLAGALPLAAEFAAGLRRHVEVEDALLAVELPVAPDAEEQVAVMRREHEDILAQLAEVEAALGGAVPEAWEIEPFVGLLSGTLAKHEQREEAGVFPHWQAAIVRLAPERSAALSAAVQRMLGGG